MQEGLTAADIIHELRQTLSPATVVEATARIDTMKLQRGFPQQLLLICDDRQNDIAVRQSAAILLKNMVQRKVKSSKALATSPSEKLMCDDDLLQVQKSVLQAVVRNSAEKSVCSTLKYVCFLFVKYLYCKGKWESFKGDAEAVFYSANKLTDLIPLFEVYRIFAEVLGNNFSRQKYLSRFLSDHFGHFVEVIKKMDRDFESRIPNSPQNISLYQKVFSVTGTLVEYHLPDFLKINAKQFLNPGLNVLEMEMDFSGETPQRIISFLALKIQILRLFNKMYVKHVEKGATQRLHDKFASDFDSTYTEKLFQLSINHFHSFANNSLQNQTFQQISISTIALKEFLTTLNSISIDFLTQNMKEQFLKEQNNITNILIQNAVSSEEQLQLFKQNCFDTCRGYELNLECKRRYLNKHITSIFDGKVFSVQQRKQSFEQVFKILQFYLLKGNLRKKQLASFLLGCVSKQLQNLYVHVNEDCYVYVEQFLTINVRPLFDLQVSPTDAKKQIVQKLRLKISVLRVFEQFSRVQYSMQFLEAFCEKLFQQIMAGPQPVCSSYSKFVIIRSASLLSHFLYEYPQLMNKVQPNAPKILMVYTELLKSNSETHESFLKIISCLRSTGFLERVAPDFIAFLCDIVCDKLTALSTNSTAASLSANTAPKNQNFSLFSPKSDSDCYEDEVERKQIEKQESLLDSCLCYGSEQDDERQVLSFCCGQIIDSLRNTHLSISSDRLNNDIIENSQTFVVRKVLITALGLFSSKSRNQCEFGLNMMTVCVIDVFQCQRRYSPETVSVSPVYGYFAFLIKLFFYPTFLAADHQETLSIREQYRKQLRLLTEEKTLKQYFSRFLNKPTEAVDQQIVSQYLKVLRTIDKEPDAICDFLLLRDCHECIKSVLKLICQMKGQLIFNLDFGFELGTTAFPFLLREFAKKLQSLNDPNSAYCRQLIFDASNQFREINYGLQIYSSLLENGYIPFNQAIKSICDSIVPIWIAVVHDGSCREFFGCSSTQSPSDKMKPEKDEILDAIVGSIKVKSAEVTRFERSFNRILRAVNKIMFMFFHLFREELSTADVSSFCDCELRELPSFQKEGMAPSKQRFKVLVFERLDLAKFFSFIKECDCDLKVVGIECLFFLNIIAEYLRTLSEEGNSETWQSIHETLKDAGAKLIYVIRKSYEYEGFSKESTVKTDHRKKITFFPEQCKDFESQLWELFHLFENVFEIQQRQSDHMSLTNRDRDKLIQKAEIEEQHCRENSEAEGQESDLDQDNSNEESHSDSDSEHRGQFLQSLETVELSEQEIRLIQSRVIQKVYKNLVGRPIDEGRLQRFSELINWKVSGASNIKSSQSLVESQKLSSHSFKSKTKPVSDWDFDGDI